MSNHVFMVLMLRGLTRAYRTYQERLDADPHEKKPAADLLGFRRWRRQVLNENADKVIVFVGETFAILPLIHYRVLISDTVRIRGAPSRVAMGCVAREGFRNGSNGCVIAARHCVPWPHTPAFPGHTINPGGLRHIINRRTHVQPPCIPQ